MTLNVKRHLGAIYRKLSIKSKMQLGSTGCYFVSKESFYFLNPWQILQLKSVQFQWKIFLEMHMVMVTVIKLS